MAGRTEDGERNERQQHGVKPGDHGHAGDAGIAEHLRDVHRRQDHARQNITRRGAEVDGADRAEEGQPHSLFTRDVMERRQVSRT